MKQTVSAAFLTLLLTLPAFADPAGTLVTGPPVAPPPEPTEIPTSNTAPQEVTAPEPPAFKSGAYLGLGYGLGEYQEQFGLTGFTVELGWNVLPQLQIGLYIGSSVNPLSGFRTDELHTDLNFGTVEVFYSPSGGHGLYLGGKVGGELLTETLEDYGAYYHATGWIAGPSVGYEFAIERRLTFGFEGDYLIATNHDIDSAALFEGFFKVRF